MESSKVGLVKRHTPIVHKIKQITSCFPDYSFIIRYDIIDVNSGLLIIRTDFEVLMYFKENISRIKPMQEPITRPKAYIATFLSILKIELPFINNIRLTIIQAIKDLIYINSNSPILTWISKILISIITRPADVAVRKPDISPFIAS